MKSEPEVPEIFKWTLTEAVRVCTAVPGFFDALESLGIEVIRGWGFVFKARFGVKSLDFLFPEENHGHSVGDDEELPPTYIRG